MKYFAEYLERVGDLVNYCALFLGITAIILGVALLFFNRKYSKSVEFLSTAVFFGCASFSIGSLIYFEYVENHKDAKILFMFVIGASFIMGVGTGLMILIPTLNFLASFMIGLAGGFCMINFFIGSSRSEYVLLVCSILFGLILGMMSHFYQYPFHIVILPFTGAYLLETGFFALLDAGLNMSSLSSGITDSIYHYVSYIFMAIFYAALFISLYYHYRTYYLRRESLDFMDDEENLIKNDDSLRKIRYPTRARSWKKSIF